MKERRSLRTTLRLGIGLLCLVILIQGALSVFLTARIQDENDQLLQAQSMSSEVLKILSSHNAWLSGMALAIYTGDEFTGGLDPDTCSLGSWMKTDYVAADPSPEVQKFIGAMVEPHRIIHESAAGLMAQKEAGGMNDDEAQRLFLETIKPNSLLVIEHLTQLEAHESGLVDAAVDKIQTLLRTFLILVLIMVLLSLTIGIAAMRYLIRDIVPPLKKITLAADALARGNTDIDLQITSRDEIGQLADSFERIQESTRRQVLLTAQVADGDLGVSIPPRSDEDGMSIALNRMTQNLNEMFHQVNATAIEVSQGASQISSSSQVLAQGTMEQAATLDVFSESVSMLAEKAEKNADIAAQSARLGADVKANALAGVEQMGELIQAVKDINEASASIGKVIKVIDDIAFQTNILALNAAVEAARAGQHGKGFAVVADEVRNLAAKSAEAAKDTNTMISDSVAKAELGQKIAERTAASLDKIVSGIEENDRITGEIASASAAQLAGMIEINQGIEQVSQAVQQNSSASEQSAAAAQEMYARSHMLTELMTHFKTDDPTAQTPESHQEPPAGDRKEFAMQL